MERDAEKLYLAKTLALIQAAFDSAGIEFGEIFNFGDVSDKVRARLTAKQQREHVRVVKSLLPNQGAHLTIDANRGRVAARLKLSRPVITVLPSP